MFQRAQEGVSLVIWAEQFSVMVDNTATAIPQKLSEPE